MAFSAKQQLAITTLAILLLGCIKLHKPLEITKQGEIFSTKSVDYCNTGSGIRVVDTSSPVTDTFLERMQSYGVEVVARFYGYTQASPPPDGSSVSDWQNAKVINEDELDRLAQYQMASIAVFQYRSDEERTFRNWQTRSISDAERALEIAKELNQPEGSLIYFGVDGDFINNARRSCERFRAADGETYAGNCSQQVRSYFKIVSERVREAGYDVGLYGSGEACRVLTDDGTVSKCWLNFSTGHTNREWGLTSEKTVLRQFSEAKAPSACGSRDIDFNQVRNPDFGQFKYGTRS